jgi:hypothetical protein
MIRGLVSILFQGFGFVVGWFLRRHQEGLVKPIRKYTRRPDDRFVQVAIDPDIIEWLKGFELPKATGEYLVCVRPTPEVILPAGALSQIDDVSEVADLANQLARLESKVDFLLEYLAQEEAGKLRANLEYLIDFANGFSHTLIMMYLHQVESQSFATILEEIELQCAQVMAALEGRNSSAITCILKAIENPRRPKSEAVLNELQKLIEISRRWHLGIRARGIAAYLRIAIPRANRPFVYQQIQRMYADNLNLYQKNRKTLLNLEKTYSDQSRNSRLKISSFKHGFETAEFQNMTIKDVVHETRREMEMCQQEITDLLKRPKRVTRELDQLVKRSFAFVVEIDESETIKKIERLLSNAKPGDASSVQPVRQSIEADDQSKVLITS